MMEQESPALVLLLFGSYCKYCKILVGSILLHPLVISKATLVIPLCDLGAVLWFGWVF